MLGLGEDLVVEHRVQDEVASLRGALGVANGRVVRRVLGQTRERGALEKVQVPHGLAEERLSCSLDAVRAVTKVDFVEVHPKDLVFRVRALDTQRQHGLLGLARQRLLMRFQDEVARQLLRQRAGTVRGTPAAAHVVEDGARQAPDVDPPVIVEAPILNRENGQSQVVRDVLEADVDAFFTIERRQRVAGRAKNQGAAHGPCVFERGQGGKVGPQRPVRGPEHSGADGHDGERSEKQGAENARRRGPERRPCRDRPRLDPRRFQWLRCILHAVFRPPRCSD